MSEISKVFEEFQTQLNYKGFESKLRLASTDGSIDNLCSEYKDILAIDGSLFLIISSIQSEIERLYKHIEESQILERLHNKDKQSDVIQ